MNTKNMTALFLAGVLLVPGAAYASISVSGDSDISIDQGDLPMQVKVDDDQVSVTGKGMEVRTEGSGMSEVKIEDANGERLRIETREQQSGSRRDDDATGTERALEVSDDHAREALIGVRLHLDEMEYADDTLTIDTTTPEGRFKEKVRTTFRSDDRLKSVDVSDDAVAVEFEQEAKLFGFVKTTLRTKAEVKANEDVEVTYPWYHIFMKKTQSRATLQSDIARAIAGERKAMQEGMSSTTAQATIAAKIGIADIFDIIARSISPKATADATASAQ